MRTARLLVACRHDERGAAALIVVMILLFATALAALFTHRNLVLEQRSSANQYRATQAFEAAEAGIEWALAQLNANQRIDASCLPSANAADTSFRARYLTTAYSTGVLTPTRWEQAGSSKPLQAACVAGAAGWSCSCPAQDVPSLSSAVGTGPAFVVSFLPSPKAGVVRVTSRGCSHFAGPCNTASATQADANATIEAAFGLVGGLRAPPAAALTARGSVEVGNAAIGIRNADPATGIAVNAGGAITAPRARLTGPAGSASAGLLAGNDSALAALPAERLFTAYFGVDKSAWRAQPAVARIACKVDCASALAAALEATADAALVYIDGDLALTGPVTLGTAKHPVAIVVNGAARFDGAVALHGLVYAASVAWHQAAEGALIHGAVLSESGYSGDGPPELSYDPLVLERLTHGAGSFARVGGSWRDF